MLSKLYLCSPILWYGRSSIALQLIFLSKCAIPRISSISSLMPVITGILIIILPLKLSESFLRFSNINLFETPVPTMCKSSEKHFTSYKNKSVYGSIFSKLSHGTHPAVSTAVCILFSLHLFNIFSFYNKYINCYPHIFKIHTYSIK